MALEEQVGVEEGDVRSFPLVSGAQEEEVRMNGAE